MRMVIENYGKAVLATIIGIALLIILLLFNFRLKVDDSGATQSATGVSEVAGMIMEEEMEINSVKNSSAVSTNSAIQSSEASFTLKNNLYYNTAYSIKDLIQTDSTTTINIISIMDKSGNEYIGNPSYYSDSAKTITFVQKGNYTVRYTLTTSSGSSITRNALFYVK